jgi:hypothetical protein
VISIGGVEMGLVPITHRQEIRQAQLRTKASSGWDGIANLLLLTVLQVLSCLGFLLGGRVPAILPVLQGFGGASDLGVLTRSARTPLGIRLF